MKRTKIAMIGCGNISGAHGKGYKAIADRAELAYCVDLIPERAEKRAREFGDENTVCLTDYRATLADPAVECVSVCLPNHLHAQVSIEALKAGKNVLCEKPAAMSCAQALEMKRAADEAGKILNIGVVNRFSRSVEMIRDYIASGRLGELYQVCCDFRAFRSIPNLGGWFTTKALSGGGALIDWGVHFLDLIYYCIGDAEIKTVSAVTHSKLAVDMRSYAYRAMHAGPPKYDGTYDVEEFVTGLVRTTGPALSFTGCWAQNIDEDRLLVDFLGDRAGIRLTYGGKFTVYATENGELKELHPEYELNDYFCDEIAAFVDSAVKGEKIRSNIDEIIKTARLMDAIYASAAAGREIVL